MDDIDSRDGYDERTRAYAAALVAAEARMLAGRSGAEDPDCPCKDGMFPQTMLPKAGRRGVLAAAGSALAAAALTPFRAAAQTAPAGAVWRDVPADPTKEPGVPVAEDGGYGTRSHYPPGGVSFTTIELKSNFLGTAREGALTCVATLAHGGRTTQIWDATVRNADTGKTLALFRCTQLIIYPK